jgi:AcrR family transcriptional regulator
LNDQSIVGWPFNQGADAVPRETRERILEAAFRTLSRKGYESTTVKDIADEAGVAPGLVHYYFRSKQELVLAVLAVCCAKLEHPTAVGSDQGVVEAFELIKTDLRDQRDANRLYVELLGVGLHDPEVGAGLLEFVRENRGKIEQVTRDVLAVRELPQERAPALAAVVWGAILGITVQHLVDPEFDAGAAVDALALMAIATVTRQRELA